MENLWEKICKGTLISAVILVSLVLLITTAQASAVCSLNSTTGKIDIDLFADGTDIQNGEDLIGVLHNGFVWDAAHTVRSKDNLWCGPVGPGATLKIHAGNYAEGGESIPGSGSGTGKYCQSSG